MPIFHTEDRRLSKGNMLGCLYELREELIVFLTDAKMNYLLEEFCEPKFKMPLTYLVDIFTQLNRLNLQLQGSGNNQLKSVANIFVFEDNLRAFLCKIDLWVDKIREKNYSVFPTLKTFANDKNYATVSAEVHHNILCHLQILKDEFTRYFPKNYNVETETIKKLIRNPFNVKAKDLPDEMQVEVIELQNDSNFRDSFESSENIELLWCKKAMSYSNIQRTALRYLMVFSTTFLCEQGFSALLLIKNKQRNRLDASDDMRIALSSSISPRIAQLVTQMQAQRSH